MSQRTALITGGARGIGKQIALELARQDWNISICYRTSEDDANDTIKMIEEIGPRGYAEKCDVSDPEAAQALVKKVEKEF
ncbi:SDR family NAD(P)-dependent oxidoreductase, partial [Ruegeria sp.]|uniref:SDR family NAD(P)-dependent oxidoreductase n=1 Tax=Ruegeria sp. TaxID=1879320 RepID=UPI00231463F7